MTKRLFLVLCVLLTFTLLELSETRNVPPSENDVWLADLEEKVRTSEIQADSAGLVALSAPVTPTCPLVVEGFEGYDCTQPPCETDADCSSPAQMCCSNGCVRTCISKSTTPLLVDWVLYPGRPPTGNSWLLSAPKPDIANGDYCTTSRAHENSSPLRCPGGYICHIEDRGNPKKNIPNRGRCVLENHIRSFDTADQFVGHDVNSSEEGRSKTGICKMGSTVYAEDTRFYRNGRPCVCRGGIVTCYKRVAK